MSKIVDVMGFGEEKSKKFAEIIGNKTSKKILEYLREKAGSETDISKELGIPLSTVHYNLQKLHDNGFIEVKDFYWSDKGNKVNIYRTVEKTFVFTNNKSKKLLTQLAAIIPIIAAILIVSTIIILNPGTVDKPSLGSEDRSSISFGHRVDDWKYDNSGAFLDKVTGGRVASTSMAESSLGFSVGGAKDINNFRENIKNNYLPLPTDMTYEGLFYDYYFDTGKLEKCNELFCPSYSYAVSKDPFSNKDDYYLSVGLNSNIKTEDFERKKLNLVVVLDISGSMSSPFNRYYYDQFGNKIELEEYDNKRKMDVAKESVVSLLDHLNDDDRFGMVLFESEAHLAKPLRYIGETDMDALRENILEIEPRGGTRMSAGMSMGTELFDDLLKVDQSEYENRIIFLTDAMPNMGDTSRDGLLGTTEGNSENKLHTTFIGIGVDFNTELIEAITKIKGANYYSVHSSKQFNEKMDDEFEFMVTPLVFDLNLKLEANGFEIEQVYGSPESNEATGNIMRVNTLFPSNTKENETKGGLILLKLKKLSNNRNLKLKVSYEDGEGRDYNNVVEVEFVTEKADFYENGGIRKGILLSRYADLMKNWMIDERSSLNNEPIESTVNEINGIVVPRELGEWERQSVPLKVSDEHEKLFSEFIVYFEEEMNSIGDLSLEKELETLKNLENREN